MTNCKNNQTNMKKLELSEGTFSHIFTMAYISDIILDKEKKVFQLIIYDCPLIEMFLNENLNIIVLFFKPKGGIMFL